MKPKVKTKRHAKSKFNDGGHAREQKFADDGLTRQRKAADHPGVREWYRLVVDAIRLQNRMHRWLVENDTPEDTAAILHLDLATRDAADSIANSIPFLMAAIRGMEWSLTNGCTQSVQFASGQVFRDFVDHNVVW